MNLQVLPVHPKSRLFPSQIQPRSKSDSTSFSNWSIFHHNSAICQMLAFNRNTDLLAEHRERQGWKSICFIAIYLPGSSARRSWMRGLAGFRATRTPNCLTPAKNSQDSFPQGTLGAHNAAEQNQCNPFSFTSKLPLTNSSKTVSSHQLHTAAARDPGVHTAFPKQNIVIF